MRLFFAVLLVLAVTACSRGSGANTPQSNAGAPVSDTSPRDQPNNAVNSEPKPRETLKPVEKPEAMPDHRIKAPADWQKLEDDKLAWLVVAEIWKWADFYEAYAPFKQQMAELTKGQRAIYATLWCDAEVDNGGFHQFFGNSTGMLGPDAVEGFRLIGMEESAKAVEAAIAWAKFDPYPRERKERQERLPDYRSNKDHWYKNLGEPFYAANEGMEAKQAAYIRAHPEEFFLP